MSRNVPTSVGELSSKSPLNIIETLLCTILNTTESLFGFLPEHSSRFEANTVALNDESPGQMSIVPQGGPLGPHGFPLLKR